MKYYPAKSTAEAKMKENDRKIYEYEIPLTGNMKKIDLYFDESGYFAGIKFTYKENDLTDSTIKLGSTS